MSELGQKEFAFWLTTQNDCNLTTAALAKVDANQLNHVGFEEVDVPPGRFFHLGQAARAKVEEGAGASVHGLLRNSSFRHA